MPSKSLNINKFIQVKDPFKLFVVFCLRHAHMESQWRHKNLHEQYEAAKGSLNFIAVETFASFQIFSCKIIISISMTNVGKQQKEK